VTAGGCGGLVDVCLVDGGLVAGVPVCLVLYFVYKQFSGFALEVQSQVRGQRSCDENPRFRGASCAGTRLADMPGQRGRVYDRM
jgi:hypothetical protein